jgi:small-conductance mechanosensitive channel
MIHRAAFLAGRRRPVRFATVLLAWLPALASNAGATDEEGLPEGSGPSTALVRLDDHAILRVRGFTGYSAGERARAIEGRIEDFARDGTVPADAMALAETPRGTAIVAGSVTLLTVTDADAALEELSRQSLALASREALVKSVASWREQRSPERLRRHAAYAAGATLLLAAIVALFVRVSRRLRALVATRIASRVRSVEVHKLEIINARHLLAAVQSIPRALLWVASIVTVYAYLEFVLRLFPRTRPIGDRLLELVTGPLESLGMSFVAQLPNIAFLAVLVLIVRYILKLLRIYFDAIEHGTVKFEQFDAEWAIPTYKVLRIFIVAFAVVVAYPYIPGSESAAFKGVSVMLGVLFSLGSSSVISNVIAGYTMTYRRAFRRGDRIRVGDMTGDVVESRLLVTTLRTPKNEIVVVPNSEILGKSVVNYSALAREQGLILHTTVGIGYETPWRQVEAMLVMAAGRTAGLKRDPAPFVLHKSLGDFCVVYEINAYTDDANGMACQYSALHANILDVFNEYGVQIMTPAYEGDPAEPKLVRPGDWHAAPARPPQPGQAAAPPRS